MIHVTTSDALPALDGRCDSEDLGAQIGGSDNKLHHVMKLAIKKGVEGATCMCMGSDELNGTTTGKRFGGDQNGRPNDMK